MKSRFRPTLLALAIGMGAVASATFSSGAVDAGDCLSTVENPHFSRGAGGVIVKARYGCANVGRLNGVLQLFLCSTRPPRDEQYIATQCTVKGYDNFDFDPVNNNVYTRYAPRLSRPGAHGTGWWVGCTIYNAGPNRHTLIGDTVYIAA